MSKTAVGFICAAVSVLGFGTNFVPVKKYQIGDGMFFQLQQALGIFTVGVVVQLIRGDQSIFRPYAMIGGFLWCTGNCMCPLIIQCIGMSLGLLIWGALNMITGWCMGQWGLFGVRASEPPAFPSMNIAGLITALLGTFLFFFVKPIGSVDKAEQKKKWEALPDGNEFSTTRNSKKAPLIEVPLSTEGEELSSKSSWVDNLSPEQRRAAGTIMAMVSGFMFGVNFAPPTVLYEDQTHIDGNELHYSPHGLDYVFSHFTGILLTSLVWFLVYCVQKKNKPVVNNKIILPGWLSGVVWGIAQACWFVANENLGLTTAYPIITTGPGIVASFWGVCVFGEIKGKENLTVLMFALIDSFIAIALITMSKAEGLLS